jgi:hypothetical protein
MWNRSLLGFYEMGRIKRHYDSAEKPHGAQRGQAGVLTSGLRCHGFTKEKSTV